MKTSPIVTAHFSKEEVLKLLLLGDEDFLPPLHSSLNLEEYSEKLSKYASFVVLSDNDETRGCIAYYLNEEKNFIYISLFWVSSRYQRQHYGSLMLEKLISTNKGYKELLLEVVKSNPARFFYRKHGFVIKEEREKKYLMSLILEQS